jgi:hypothetical protein
VKDPAPEEEEEEEEEHAIRRRRSKGMNVGQIKLNDVLPLIENNLTIAEVADKLGIAEETTRALVAASLRSSRARDQ